MDLSTSVSAAIKTDEFKFDQILDRITLGTTHTETITETTHYTSSQQHISQSHVNEGQIKATKYVPENTNKSKSQGQDELLKAFHELDIASEERAFAEWLDRKKRARSQQSRTPHITTPLPITSSSPLPMNSTLGHQRYTLNDQELEMMLANPEACLALPPDYVDALIRRLERNKQAYNEWMQEKEAQRKKQLEIDARKRRAEIERQRRAKAEEQQRHVLSKIRIRQWMQQKVVLQVKSDMKSQMENEVKKAKLLERKKEGEIAYKKWLAAHSDPSNNQHLHGVDTYASHKDQWVDIAPPITESLVSSSSDRPRKSKRLAGRTTSKESVASNNVIYSPPNLYNDYARYKQLAPQYFVKYPAFVASAGMGIYNESIHQQQSESTIVSIEQPSHENRSSGSKSKSLKRLKNGKVPCKNNK